MHTLVEFHVKMMKGFSPFHIHPLCVGFASCASCLIPWALLWAHTRSGDQEPQNYHAWACPHAPLGHFAVWALGHRAQCSRIYSKRWSSHLRVSSIHGCWDQASCWGLANRCTTCWQLFDQLCSGRQPMVPCHRVTRHLLSWEAYFQTLTCQWFGSMGCGKQRALVFHPDVSQLWLASMCLQATSKDVATYNLCASQRKACSRFDGRAFVPGKAETSPTGSDCKYLYIYILYIYEIYYIYIIYIYIFKYNIYIYIVYLIYIYIYI